MFFRSGGGGGDDETDEKLRSLSRRPEAREEAVPIKKEGDPSLSPQDKSESLKPHSGSHKDEIKSAEEERGGENEGLPVPSKVWLQERCEVGRRSNLGNSASGERRSV